MSARRVLATAGLLAITATGSLAGTASASIHRSSAGGPARTLGCVSVTHHNGAFGGNYLACKSRLGPDHRGKYVAVFDRWASGVILTLAGGKCGAGQVKDYMLLTPGGRFIAVNAGNGDVPRRYAKWAKGRIGGGMIFYVCI